MRTQLILLRAGRHTVRHNGSTVQSNETPTFASVFDAVGELCVGVLLLNRPYPPTRRPSDLAEIGLDDLAYRLRMDTAQFFDSRRREKRSVALVRGSPTASVFVRKGRPLFMLVAAIPMAILGGLIGLGGAELRLPGLAGPLGHTARKAVPINLAVRLTTITASLSIRGRILPSRGLFHSGRRFPAQIKRSIVTIWTFDK